LLEAAMSEADCAIAIAIGRGEAEKAIANGANLLIACDIGLGNTTASACIICRITGASAENVVGFGTGIDQPGQQRKIDVVKGALSRISGCTDNQLLQQVGGFEIVAMAGFYLQAAESGVPVVIDGFIASAASLAARVIEPELINWMLASHVSQEHGHALALDALRIEALINFEMCLGEGSGAAVVIPLLKSAIALHNEMATFENAGVTDRDG